VLTLAFDTATDAASCALVRNGDVLGERPSRAVRILHEIDEVLAGACVEPAALDGIVVGTGPGSYTGLRMGLVTARTLALSLGIPVAGVSTLDALAAGNPGSRPVLDARRGEVFTLVAGEYRCVRPDNLELEPGETAVGDGAVRYRDVLEGSGALVAPDESPVHVPWARHLALLASAFGPPEAAEPIYLRAPDAERKLPA
jgi:tRNA threonylcarbamoyladenosine biosynthesis protein TsaB